MTSSSASSAPAAAGRIILLLSLAAFASSAALRICDAMLPALARDFSTTVGRAAAMVTAASVAYGFCQLLFGPLGDRYGKIRVIAWACLASTLGTAACAAGSSLDALVAARALTGATTAALIPLSMAWIGDVVPMEERQPTLARYMSGQILGLVGGQALGGLFADTIGWRWAFALLAVAYFVVGLLVLRAVPRSAAGMESTPPHAHAGTLERWRHVILRPGAWGILSTVFIESLLVFGALAFSPSVLHQRFGISLFHAGAIVAGVGLGGLLYSLFARRWVGRLGATGLAASGGALLGVAFLTLAVAPHWGWGLAACIVAGLGFYQMHNTLQTQATQLAPAARGTAVSLFAACFFLGQSAGVTLGGLVVDHADPVWLFAVSAAGLPLLGWRLRRRLVRAAAEASRAQAGAGPAAAADRA